MKTTTPKDASKTPKPLTKPLVPRSDADIVASQYRYELSHKLEQALERGSRELIIRIILPEASPLLPARSVTYNVCIPTFAKYEVVDSHEHMFCVLGEAQTWEEACDLLRSLHGTQKRGHCLQINGMDANGLIVEEDLLQHGIFIWA